VKPREQPSRSRRLGCTVSRPATGRVPGGTCVTMEPRAACALAVHPVTNSIDRPLSRGHAVARTRAFLAGAALEQKKLPPARTAPCALRGPTQSASRPIRTGGWTPVRPLEQAGEPRTRHCGGCGMPRPQLVINAHGWSPRPRRDRPPARANCRRNRRFGPPAAAEVDPGEVPSSELATHTAPAVTAAPAAPRPTSIGRRASLRARCWMGYCWSKKVRTSALKRAGCSMFGA
jgi:hypothetical protein